MPVASLGATNPAIRKIISLASTNALSIRSQAALIQGYLFANQHSTDWAWMKLYNLDVAPTVGTSVPDITLGLPPLSAGHIDFRDYQGGGIAFGTGLGFALTADEADGDSGAVAAGSVVVNLLFG